MSKISVFQQEKVSFSQDLTRAQLLAKYRVLHYYSVNLKLHTDKCAHVESIMFQTYGKRP